MLTKSLLYGIYLAAVVTAVLVSNTGSATKSYHYPAIDTVNYTSSEKDTAEKKYLALGDSYTIGQNVLKQDRYPAQTRKWLRAAGVTLKDPDYIATTGWATINLLAALSSKKLPHNYDVVTLLIGVNDQYQGRDTGLYRLKFTEALRRAISLAGERPSRVVVLSIPDYSVTPFVRAANKPKVRRGVNCFNAINRQVALEHRVAYLDITPVSREAEKNLSLLSFDEMHPSGLEYSKWACMLGPIIKKMFR